jgi:hypothetical protein
MKRAGAVCSQTPRSFLIIRVGRFNLLKREVACSMPREARWIHGNAIVAETLHPALDQVDERGVPLTYTDIVGLRQGFGLTYQGNIPSFPWFHAMIPTPVIVNNKRTRLDRVFVLYKTTNPVAVREIHVWDGQRFIKHFDVTRGTGDKTQGPPPEDRSFLEGENTFFIDGNPEVFFGIGISIHVEFGVRGVTPGPAGATIQFISAGADFITSS